MAGARQVWARRVEPQLNDYMGKYSSSLVVRHS